MPGVWGWLRFKHSLSWGLPASRMLMLSMRLYLFKIVDKLSKVWWSFREWWIVVRLTVHISASWHFNAIVVSICVYLMIECLIGYYLLCITLVYALLLVTLCGCHFVELLVFLIFQFLVYGLWSTFKFGVTLISIYVFIYIYMYIFTYLWVCCMYLYYISCRSYTQTLMS